MFRKRASRPRRLESLEDRALMAGDINFANGIISLTGDNYVDTAEARFEGDRVFITLLSKNANGSTDQDQFNRQIQGVVGIEFDARNGDDTMNVVVNALNAGVDISPITIQFYGSNGNDTFKNATNAAIKSNAHGDAGDDVLSGGGGDDYLSGGADNDVYKFIDGTYHLGTDSISDYGGSDTLDFSQLNHSVTVDLAIQNTQVAASGTLLLTLGTLEIENVIGSNFQDTIRGNSLANRLVGMGDWDTLEGRGGNDLLEGNSGADTYVFKTDQGLLGLDSILEGSDNFFDTLDFRGFAQGVNVDLAKSGNNLAVDNGYLKLRLLTAQTVENVFGSDFADEILGNDRVNTLRGGNGSDIINGRGGADWLYGDGGNDALFSDLADQVYGGTGSDRFDGILETFVRTKKTPARYRDWGTF